MNASETMLTTSNMIYPLICFTLLSCQHILYGCVYQFPHVFIKLCREGSLGEKFRKDEIWRSFMLLSFYFKTFQFGVIAYDTLVHNGVHLYMGWHLLVGALLFGVGQLLNSAVYKTLGAKGVYYGNEFGYKCEYVTGFPYNIGISDPQYWGCILSFYGTYIFWGVESMMVPCFGFFWYFLSMKLLENSNGMALMKALGLVDDERNPSKAAKEL